MKTFLEWVAEMTTKPMYGWLTPSRDYIETRVYGHVQEIGKNPMLKKYIPWFDREWESAEELARSSQEMLDQGEHPEWHSYEMAQDDLKTRVVSELYGKGLLRVGTQQGVMYFEGSPGGIKNLYEYAKQFAESHGMSAKFEPMK